MSAGVYLLFDNPGRPSWTTTNRCDCLIWRRCALGRLHASRRDPRATPGPRGAQGAAAPSLTPPSFSASENGVDERIPGSDVRRASGPPGRPTRRRRIVVVALRPGGRRTPRQASLNQLASPSPASLCPYPAACTPGAASRLLEPLAGRSLRRRSTNLDAESGLGVSRPASYR